MDKLEELQKEIRSKLPRLMEVSKGCLFYNETWVDSVLVNYDSLGYCVASNGLLSQVKDYKKGEIESKEIIGHPILLSDVLEWCFTFTGLGELSKWDYQRDDYIYSQIDWDLSKPHLKDQSEELINYLHKLK